MNPPTASVIIPVLNGEATIGTLLAALKNQAGYVAAEIIVVDNGSTDRTLEIARASGATVLQQPVRGPSAARNLGSQQARADILIFADSDTIPSRRWLVSLVRAFDDPNVIIASGPILGWQPKTPAERYSSMREVYSRKNSVDHPHFPFAIGMSLAVRRQSSLEIGGWDETMNSGEDVDFCFRLRQRFGNKIHYAEAAVLFHQHRCTDAALWKQARWHGAGHALFLHRHYDFLPWRFWHSVNVWLMLGILHGAMPLVSLGRLTGLMKAQRAEFENYHRRWQRHYWLGFFQQRKKFSV
jgi:glycosyltransferase involved in cell wall biosynthesis